MTEKDRKLNAGTKILIAVTAFVLALTIFIISPIFKSIISKTIMRIYSAECEKEALTTERQIQLCIPDGSETSERDWFPLMMTFVPGYSFGKYINQRTTLTILYDFPAFSPIKGCSYLYDENSDYYSSFYGAYLVSNDDGTPYGFVTAEDDVTLITDIQPDQIAAVAKYDYHTLVLADFGLTPENAEFEFTVDHVETTEYLGSDEWYRADATIYTNGCAHNKTSFVQSYLQYGIPDFPTEAPLAPVKLHGRIYGKYLPEKNVSIFFYIIAKSEIVLEKCDTLLLSKSRIAY